MRLNKRRFITKSGTLAFLLIILLLLALFSLSTLGGATALGNDLSLELEWSSEPSDNTSSMAWGDFDNDGDLDLVVGNFSLFGSYPIYLYRNDNGTLGDAPLWQSTEASLVNSIAWGDVDSDGDLDLAVGNFVTQASRIYRNDGFSDEDGLPLFTVVWETPETMATTSVAWGDFDNDGDLDLALGNDAEGAGGERNRLYRNEGLNGEEEPILSLFWQSNEALGTSSLVWGDYDNDGDLDLAVANGEAESGAESGQANQLYLNDNGTLSAAASWSSTEDDISRAIAWGDYDNDGRLDLAVGNLNAANRLYRNVGGESMFELAWSSEEQDGTSSVAWGDYDNDGYLDLAFGNREQVVGQPNRIYRNSSGVLSHTAFWSSTEEDLTNWIGWADYDNDGDLDLAAGNGARAEPRANRLYRNDNEPMSESSLWQSTESEQSMAVAWGDYDSDGDLDLVVANLSENEPNRLYRNQNGTLDANPVWSSNGAYTTTSLAWGDYDADGDLDLLVGNAGVNQIYRNDNGSLGTSAVWSSSESDFTSSVAWADYDGDGDLDFAVGTDFLIFPRASRLYRNDGLDEDDVPVFTLAWNSSSTVTNTQSVAWGDYDSDGDLDLLLGNGEHSLGIGVTDAQQNHLYRNDNGTLTQSPVWISTEVDSTQSLAWADYDSDGDLDFVVGNLGEPNRLYENNEGEFTVTWNSVEEEATNSVAWGDYDGDGDLDLVVGNGGLNSAGGQEPQSARIYRNQNGTLSASSVWRSADEALMQDIAWGDADGDGDLDLAVANFATGNHLYQNRSREGAPLLNQPSTVLLHRPGLTDDSYFFSTPEILQATDKGLSIPYLLIDQEGDEVSRIIPQFSPNGGGEWFPATPGSGGDDLINLSASPEGSQHTFSWNAEADLIKSDNVIFRIQAQSGFQPSPIQSAAYDGKSPPFRVQVPFFIKVLDDDGHVVSGVPIYANGQPITQTVNGASTTDEAGLLNPGQLEIGTPLVALAQRFEQATARQAHDGWAYRTFISNLNLADDGTPQPFTVSDASEQRLILQQDNTLILFNIVVSIEWNAEEAYLEMMERAFERASDYLYDVTDGQMAFAQVSIYDNAENWNHADFQLSTKNTVRPYAFIGGITSDDTAHSIRVGRFWSGNSGNEGDWDQPNGYRTLIHEFGHYALYLYDEYFVREIDDDGNLIGQTPAHCTDPNVSNGTDDTPTNASIMYWQYNTSELADSDRWMGNCENTEQARVNGEPDWQTVLGHYEGPDWQLESPESRGSVMAGPETFPNHLLPFPNIEVNNTGPTGPQRQLTVLAADGNPISEALVALYTMPYSYTVVIDQGLTDAQGQLTIYGAVEGDIIQVASLDGALASSERVDERLEYVITLSPTRAPDLPISAHPYLEVIPGSEGDTLAVKLSGATGGNLLAIVIPAEGAGLPQSTPLAYSPSEEAYTAQVSFAAVGLGSGEVQLSGMTGNQSVIINSDYNLFGVIDADDNDLASEDGNLQLHIAAGSLLNHANAYAAIFPTGYIPSPPPTGKEILGSTYGIRFSGAATALTKPALLTMHYHPDVVGKPTNLAIYHWNSNTNNWTAVGGAENDITNALSAPITDFGIYALMADGIGGESQESHIYLPLIVN